MSWKVLDYERTRNEIWTNQKRRQIVCKIQNKGKQKTEIAKLKKQKQKQSKKQERNKQYKKLKKKQRSKKKTHKNKLILVYLKRLKIPNGYAITRRRDNTIAKEGQNYK